MTSHTLYMTSHKRLHKCYICHLTHYIWDYIHCPLYWCHQTQCINYTTTTVRMTSHTLYLWHHIQYAWHHIYPLWHHTPLCLVSHPLYLWHHIQYIWYHTYFFHDNTMTIPDISPTIFDITATLSVSSHRWQHTHLYQCIAVSMTSQQVW